MVSIQLHDQLANYCEAQVGTLEYATLQSKIHERKECCCNEHDYSKLVQDTQVAIDAAQRLGNYDIAVILMAHQSDNFYVQSGHSKISHSSNSGNAKILEASLEQAKKARGILYEWIKENKLKYPEHCKVWVLGYLAMAQLCHFKFGEADNLLQKVGRILESTILIPTRHLQLPAECKVEKAFWRNCSGRYGRDFLAHRNIRSASHTLVNFCSQEDSCLTKEKALEHFEQALKLHLLIGKDFGKPLFKYEVILMKINLVRTLLNNPGTTASWDDVPHKDDLERASILMQEVALLMDGNKFDCKQKRMEFREQYYNSILHFKIAQSLIYELDQKIIVQKSHLNLLCQNCCETLRNASRNIHQAHEWLEQCERYDGVYKESLTTHEMRNKLKKLSINVQRLFTRMTRHRNSNSMQGESSHTSITRIRRSHSIVYTTTAHPSADDHVVSTKLCHCGQTINMERLKKFLDEFGKPRQRNLSGVSQRGTTSDKETGDDSGSEDSDRAPQGDHHEGRIEGTESHVQLENKQTHFATDDANSYKVFVDSTKEKNPKLVIPQDKLPGSSKPPLHPVTAVIDDSGSHNARSDSQMLHTNPTTSLGQPKVIRLQSVGKKTSGEASSTSEAEKDT